jgi:protease-4
MSGWRRLAVVAALGMVVACEGRPRTGTAAGASRDEPHHGPEIAVLNLSGGLPEQPSGGLLGLPSKSGSFDDLVREVERLGSDKDVRGVLVRLGTAHIALARATEVGSLLEALGAKVPVWCHADDLGNASLYLAARGCKRVWLSPAGTVDAVGLAAQLVFFHKLLAEQLGLEVDFLQVGKYKGAEEPFTRDGPSPEARASLEATLAGMRAAWLDGLRKARPDVTDDTPEDGPYGAGAAKQRSLIDDIGFLDEARDAMRRATGAVREEVRFGSGQPSGGDDLSDVLRAIAGESLGGAPVALVRADGAISMEGGGGPLSDSGGIVERRIVRTLQRIEKDDAVKAVVLRIDSPGGSALASDLIWHALMRIRAKKPLVVSIGGMAASGGYYLASSGTVVYADEASIVGSIGVVSGKIAADRALSKIGVHAETIPAKTGDGRAAARAAYESLLQPWDDATRARLLATMTGIYELFLARVAEGRGISTERVSASAEGRIFSGTEAKTRGLVDELGGLAEAVARARKMAGLSDDARFAAVSEASGFLEALADDPPRGQSSAGTLLAQAVPGVAHELAPFAASLAPILSHDPLLCAVPFALTVR